MAPVIVSKRRFLALVLWVLKGMNGCRVIIRIETGHSNLVSCFGPRIRALALYFTSAFASVKYLSQRPHLRAKTWHKIWMTGLNPTNIICWGSHIESPRICTYGGRAIKIAISTSQLKLVHALLCFIVIWCPWWRHQMETFSTLLAISAGN